MPVSTSRTCEFLDEVRAMPKPTNADRLIAELGPNPSDADIEAGMKRTREWLAIDLLDHAKAEPTAAKRADAYEAVREFMAELNDRLNAMLAGTQVTA